MPIVPSPIVARSDWVRPVTNTLAPWRANSLAIPRPIPRLPPVTTTTKPCTLMRASLPCQREPYRQERRREREDADYCQHEGRRGVARFRQCRFKAGNQCWRYFQQRLFHHLLGREHFAYAFLEMLLVNFFQQIAAWFSGRGQSRFQHGVADIAAAHFIGLGQRAEIHIVGERCARWMNLHTPDLLAFL